MNIIHEISIDFQRPGVRPKIHIKENDLATRRIHILFFDGGEPYPVTVSTTTAVVCYAKSDGTSGVYDHIGEGDDAHQAYQFDSNGKGVTIEIAPSMANGFGLIRCEVRLVAADQILSTFTFDIEVERSVTSGTRADDYFSYRAMDQLYDYVDDAVGKIDSLASGNIVKMPYEIVPVRENEGSVIRWDDGTAPMYGSLARYRCTNLINISGHDQIHYSRIKLRAKNFIGGMAFYRADLSAIPGTKANNCADISEEYEPDVWTYVDATLAVPADAVYARFTLLAADVDGFYCGYKPAIAERIDQLSDHIDTEVAAISDKVDTGFGEYLNVQNVDLSADTTYPVKITNHKNQNAIIHISGSWTGTTAPSIRANRARWNPGKSTRLAYFGTPTYTIGYEPNRVSTVEFRIPAQEPSVQLLNIIVSVPAGTNLHINELSIRYDGSVCRDEMPVAFWAHGMNGGAYPVNTMAAFEGAARLGYRYCITIPKVTYDGTLVCFHDDDDIFGHYDTSKNPPEWKPGVIRGNEGEEIEIEHKKISDYKYDDLTARYDIGVSRGADYKGERIPTLAQFFALCAKTGMHPALSVHPPLDNPDKPEETPYWNAIKNLAKKYNVLQTLNIKAPSTKTLGLVASVLGNDIESYTLNSADESGMAGTLKTTCDRYNIKVRVCIEYKRSVLDDAKISSALANGFTVGVYNHFEDTRSPTGLYYASEVDDLIKKGVTQFSEDRIANNGLAW